MNAAKLEKVYKGLCVVAIFKGVLSKTPFSSFLRYCALTDGYEKHRAYADFVSEIYEEGGNLTELVFRRVAEDENVYVKNKAKKIPLDPNIERQAEKELSLFSLFGKYFCTTLDKLSAGLKYSTSYIFLKISAKYG